MLRLMWFALFVLAAWYGWTHWERLRGPRADEIVVLNRSGAAIERVRIGVGDDVVVFELVEDGAEQRRDWRGRARGGFRVQWVQRGKIGERDWRGGAFEPSDTPQVHRFEFQRDGRILSHSERRTPAR